MTKLVYRGVEHDADKKPAVSLVEQMRSPELVYRGVAHDGKRARPATGVSQDYVHFYRGVRYA